MRLDHSQGHGNQKCVLAEQAWLLWGQWAEKQLNRHNMESGQDGIILATSRIELKDG